jgi:hypothetical protein
MSSAEQHQARPQAPQQACLPLNPCRAFLGFCLLLSSVYFDLLRKSVLTAWRIHSPWPVTPQTLTPTLPVVRVQQRRLLTLRRQLAS